MIIKTNILTCNNHVDLVFQKNAFLNINENKIVNITDNYTGDYKDYTNYLALPGFIDTHTHISQKNIMGLQKPSLLDWLDTYVFPEEEKFTNRNHANAISKSFFDNAIKNGTTCLVAYTTIHREACDIAFENAKKAGIRALIGKVMMDINSPEKLTENASKSIEDSISLYEKWHGKHPLLEYIFSPRFAISCSKDLMKEVGDFIKKNNAYMQTHLSENLDEIANIKSLYPGFKSYADVYYQCNLMGEKSIFGHCVHLTEEEIDLLKGTNSKIAYCADSNFYLKSGEFDIKSAEENGVVFALASDIGAGTSFSMPYHAKMSIYRQSHTQISPAKAFYLMTLAGAEVLSMQDRIGSIEINKEADIVFYDYTGLSVLEPESILSRIIYTDMSSQIKQVMIAGKELI
ncbi:MAG TPA: guanine deaminase [Candidatus Cloacimonadota bacterium]|nr:guanine deaminase [Candidatus Cloacimonadota bacterium]HOQ80317.1 guanine deaminase [Candidatus Cloacimonadota bacterium]HPY97155.1 guanine deaminase [Candidatus Cloacimonadota bacterium]HQB41602.1 guanine deaminase [Candidatus Cloacimonadota bacterium]